MMQFLLTALPTVVNIDKSTLDFSIIDTIVGAIVALIVTAIVFATLGFFLVKYGIVTFGKGAVPTTPQQQMAEQILLRLEAKVDSWFQQHLECRERQQNEFVKYRDFEDWQKGRNGPGGLWETINHHAHDPKTGGVVRTK